MATITNLSTLKINYLTQAQYDTELAEDRIDENQLYFTPSNDSLLSFDTTASSGTDYDLYQAITALGWGNDVIE